MKILLDWIWEAKYELLDVELINIVLVTQFNGKLGTPNPPPTA